MHASRIKTCVSSATSEHPDATVWSQFFQPGLWNARRFFMWSFKNVCLGHLFRWSLKSSRITWGPFVLGIRQQFWQHWLASDIFDLLLRSIQFSVAYVLFLWFFGSQFSARTDAKNSTRETIWRHPETVRDRSISVAFNCVNCISINSIVLH